jgi:DNA-binding LacI/PurR family transcriptional regulator
VPLSSVDQGSSKIGKAAAIMALRLAHSRVASRPRIELIPPRIVARASSLRRAAPSVQKNGSRRSTKA